MLINAEKHLDIFKKIVEISRCFVQKNRAILLSFLKEFTESKKREKSVFPIIQGKTKKIACPDNDFLVVQAGYYMYLKNYFSGVFSNVAVRKS